MIEFTVKSLGGGVGGRREEGNVKYYVTLLYAHLNVCIDMQIWQVHVFSLLYHAQIKSQI